MTAADYRLLTDATGQRMAAALEGMSVDRAAKTDLTSIIATGTTNTTGAAIAAGTYFYLNGALVQAKEAINSGATFTSGTNYEAVTAGGLNSLKKMFDNMLVSGSVFPASSKPKGIYLIQPTSSSDGYPDIYFPVLSCVYNAYRGFQLQIKTDSILTRVINNGEWTLWQSVSIN